MTTTTTAAALSADQLKRWEEEGYVIIDELCGDDAALEELRAAAARLTARARAGEWPHGIRTASTPFPPYSQDASHDVWGVHTLIHPDAAEPAVMAYYGGEALRAAVAALLGVEVTDLQLELVNMLVNPETTEGYSLPWHRDLVPATVEAEEEAAMLAKGAGEQSGVQWNTALYDDASFVFVPGSHNRVRTDAERAISLERPSDAMPGEVTLMLRAGATVVYNPNLLHRGVYDHTKRRATLHCSMGSPSLGGATRAANMLHVLGRDKAGWITSEEFKASLPEGLRQLHEALMASLAVAIEKGLVPDTDDDDERIKAYKRQVAAAKK